MTDQPKILREYVRIVLQEDGGGDGYGGAGDMMDMGGPFGIAWGGPSLYQTFLEPFVDVFKSGEYAIKRVGSSTREALRVLATGLVNALVPFVEMKYVGAFKAGQERLSAIKRQYQEVLERVDSKLMGDDAQLLSFLLDPTGFLALKVAKNSPKVAVWAIETLLGGQFRGTSSTRSTPARSSHSSSSEDHSGGGGGLNWNLDMGMGDTSTTESLAAQLIIHESISAEELIGNKTFRSLLEKNPAGVLSNQSVKQALESSPAITKMKQASLQLTTSGIKNVLDSLDELMNVKTLDQLRQVLSSGGGNINVPDMSNVDPNVRQQMEAQAVTLAKISAADAVSKQFKHDASRYVQAGVPKDNPLVKAFLAGSSRAEAGAERLRNEVSKYNSNDEKAADQTNAKTSKEIGSQPGAQRNRASTSAGSDVNQASAGRNNNDKRIVATQQKGAKPTN